MVTIITDTTACLPTEIAERFSITVIPQIINIGEKSYYEEVEIDNATFMKYIRNLDDLPKTAAPPPELFVKEFERVLHSGETILCIHPSDEVSGTIRSATIAAQEFPDSDIRIIDTRTVGSPLATMVQLAVEWASMGLDGDAIENKLRTMIPRSRIYFLVDTLDYLAKGGRIGGATVLLGSILKIKPILVFKDGRVDQFEKERTHKRAVKRLQVLATTQAAHNSNAYLSIMHADAYQEAESLALWLKKEFAIDHIPICNVPPAIVTHGGPGLLAVAFFTD
jgi:DegV family protein with EDD domain